MKRTVLFSLLTFQQLIAQDVIHLYSAYGNVHSLIVEGRVLDEREFQETSKDDGLLLNLWRKLGHIFNDERKNIPIVLEVNQEKFQTKTDDEGYFEFELNLPSKALNPDTIISLSLPEQPKVHIKTIPFIPSSKPQIGVISDFDDTLIISDVTQKLSLLNELLLKNYKQRKAIEGMAQRIEKLLSKSPDKPFFVITGSPKQLNRVIHLFLDYQHFPQRTVITKKIHGDNAYALFNQHRYKEEQIQRLIGLYPHIRWVLFGDSSEADREIYKTIAKKYPKHIQAAYIRNVHTGEIEKLTLLSVQTK